MKQQNPDIPFVAHRKHSTFRWGLQTDTQIDALLLDPHGILVEYAGSYKYIAKNEVANVVRVLRDRLKIAPKTLRELEFSAQMGIPVNSEVGQAVETMSTEIKTLQKKCEENYPEACSSG